MNKTTNTHTRLSFDEWAEQYKPQTNTLDPHASFDGLMFETYGDEMSEVLAIANSSGGDARVWTWVECDDDDDGLIVEGYHRVNRIGYFITNEPSKAGVQYSVTID